MIRCPGVNLALNLASFAVVLADSLLELINPRPVEVPSTMWADVSEIPL